MVTLTTPARVPSRWFRIWANAKGAKVYQEITEANYRAFRGAKPPNRPRGAVRYVGSYRRISFDTPSGVLEANQMAIVNDELWINLQTDRKYDLLYQGIAQKVEVDAQGRITADLGDVRVVKNELTVVDTASVLDKVDE